MALALLFALMALAQESGPVPEAILSTWTRGDRLVAVELLAEELERRPAADELRSVLVDWEIAIHRYQAAWSQLERLGVEHDRQRGQVLYQLGRYEESLAYLDGRHPAHTLARLDVLEALGRDEEARAALEVAAEVLGQDHPSVRAGRGRVHAREGRHELATTEFRAALAADALSQEARFGLGRSLLALGKKDEGLAVLAEHRRLGPRIDRLQFALESLDLAPAHAPNLAEVGDCHRLLGRIDLAREFYERAESLARPEQRVAIALRHARLLFEDLGDIDLALAVLDRSFESVKDPRLLVRAGDYLRSDGELSKAATRFERALEFRPGDPAILQRFQDVREALAEKSR